MDLSQIKFVDMRLSKWDKKTANPKEGKYDFEEKVYVDYRGAKASRPDIHLYWERYDPRNNYLELREAKYRFGNSGYVPVEMDTDPYWPEPLAPDVNGHYVFGDLILVKCRLLDYLQDKKERKMIDAQQTGQKKLDKLQADMEREGASISVTELEELLPKA